jgi:glycosyltransferase involved in cell wall biosynthesis
MNGKHPGSGRAQSPLDIALVTETYPPEVNGVALTLARLVAGLRQRGHRVRLIRPRQRGEEMPVRKQDLIEHLVPGLPIPGYPGLRFGLPCRRELHRIWSRNPPDIVHVATEGPLGSAAVAAARSLGLPISSGFHTNFQAYSRYYGFGWLRGLVARHLRRFHNRTDLTLAPTHSLARTLVDDGYRNVAVLARGVDRETFHPDRRCLAMRQAWGADDDAPVVAYVGRLAAEKNILLAVEAFQALAARHPNARMLFVGDGPLLHRLARRYPRYIFAGMRLGEDLAAHYASADIFLFPSLTETFGNVVPEALASGLAVLAFDCAAAADLIEDGHNGRLVPPGDTRAFVAAAVDLADRPEQLRDLRRNAAASIAQLDWQCIHDGFAGQLMSVTTTWRMSNDPVDRPDDPGNRIR